MRKYLFLLIVLCCAFNMNAQLGEKTTFGLRAGIGFGGFKSSEVYKLIGGTKESNWNITTKNKATYNAGIIVDIPVYRKWKMSFQTGLWFTERNTKFECVNANSASTWRDLDIKAMFLQLPLQLGYHYNLKIINVQALFGPYLEYRINDGTSHANYSTSKVDIKTDAFSPDDNKIGAGLTFGLGVEYKHSYLGFKYDLGLTNYYSGSNEKRKEKDELDLKGSMFSIVLGWNF